LQAQFAIVRGPARFWDQEVLWYIISSCITWLLRMNMVKIWTTPDGKTRGCVKDRR
jgi:hypothetical protein